MAFTLSAEQILALAPDAASQKAGRDLARKNKWVSAGCNPRVIWGECQGSGKLPYQTQADLQELAFKCSCPSRKFPCKHGLGLLLLKAAEPDAAPEAEPPQWVTEWLQSREAKAEKKAQKESAAPAQADPEAAAKRLRERETKVSRGVEALELWLRDLARQGLASAQTQSGQFWESTAARLADAQAPGLARLVREMGGAAASGQGWQERLLHRIARLWLLVEGWQRIATLSPEVQCDIRTAIGFAQNQDDLLKQPGVRDTWIALGIIQEREDRLRVRRTWLRGAATGRSALLLDFAHGADQMEAAMPPGSETEAELVFYPSAAPLRALVKQRLAAPAPPQSLSLSRDIGQSHAEWRDTLAACPWRDLVPMSFERVFPEPHEGAWRIRDEAGRTLPLARSFDQGWTLLALSGGEPLALFGEWDHQLLRPLTAFKDGRTLLLGQTI